MEKPIPHWDAEILRFFNLNSGKTRDDAKRRFGPDIAPLARIENLLDDELLAFGFIKTVKDNPCFPFLMPAKIEACERTDELYITGKGLIALSDYDARRPKPKFGKYEI